LVEILTNFSFYVYFLAVLWLSGVPLYADENQITTSASKCDSPFIFDIEFSVQSYLNTVNTQWVMKHRISPKTVGITAASTVYGNEPVSFFIVCRVVEQGK